MRESDGPSGAAWNKQADKGTHSNAAGFLGIEVEVGEGQPECCGEKRTHDVVRRTQSLYCGLHLRFAIPSGEESSIGWLLCGSKSRKWDEHRDPAATEIGFLGDAAPLPVGGHQVGATETEGVTNVQLVD